MVNDHTSDQQRSRLTALIPSVIGLTTPDPRADAWIALCCATAALPVASAERQQVMAVSVLSAERALATLEHRPVGDLRPDSVAALASAPLAAAWARSFIGRVGGSIDEFRRHGAPHIVRIAVPGIAQACVPDPDERLHDLLTAVIAECAAVRAEGITAPPQRTRSMAS